MTLASSYICTKLLDLYRPKRCTLVKNNNHQRLTISNKSSHTTSFFALDKQTRPNFSRSTLIAAAYNYYTRARERNKHPVCSRKKKNCSPERARQQFVRPLFLKIRVYTHTYKTYTKKKQAWSV